jgi:hypothetical protein
MAPGNTALLSQVVSHLTRQIKLLVTGGVVFWPSGGVCHSFDVFESATDLQRIQVTADMTNALQLDCREIVMQRTSSGLACPIGLAAAPPPFSFPPGADGREGLQ